MLPRLRGALGSSRRGVLAGGYGRPTGQVVWARGGARVAASGRALGWWPWWLCCQGYEGPSVAPGEGSSLAVVGGPLARLCGPGRARRGFRQGLGAEAQVAVLSATEGASAVLGEGSLACGSGGSTGRGEVRVGRVSWGGVGGPHPSAADVAGAARGLRAVSKKKEWEHMYTSTRGDACLPVRGKTCFGVQT